MKKTQQIELLAPAKDLECGICAINFGADAVYIGAKNFGARSQAGNDLEDIEKLINFAHKYFAKVYVTVNTILNDREILEAEVLIKKLYDLGTDAIIIQDVGLLELDLPPIPVFASTQMHNVSLEKIRFLQDVGINRVILARELSLSEIKHISDNTNIDLEVFIHGSLCVCYSGQCYMSHTIGGRSANRGECAQPCRKKYSMIDTNNKFISKDMYLLSLKDLNLSDYIEDLINLGVSSFKIEGRLKDSNYVKNVVAYYRTQIDMVLDKLQIYKASSGKCYLDFMPNLNKTFNRGYTSFFISGKNDSISSIYTPKSIGESIGVVKKLTERCFTISSDNNIVTGDGICFFDKQNSLQGTIIEKIIGTNIYPQKIDGLYKGISIYRNLDKEFQKTLKTSKTKRYIDIKFNIYDNNKELILNVTDEDNIKAAYKIIVQQEIAKDKEMLIENIKKQLYKLGETEFKLTDLSINIKNYYFVTIKDLNELRRKAIDELRYNRQQNKLVFSSSISKNNVPFYTNNLKYSYNIYNNKAVEFYKRHGVTNYETAIENTANNTGKKLMTTKHCLKYLFGLCSKYNKASKHSYLEPFYLQDDHNQRYKLQFNCESCFMEILL